MRLVPDPKDPTKAVDLFSGHDVRMQCPAASLLLVSPLVSQDVPVAWSLWFGAAIVS